MGTSTRVYPSRAVANYLLERAGASGGLDALQTIKLTYIAHGFSLGFYDDSLLKEEIEAWKFGPVIRPVYAMLPFGSANIHGPLGPDRPDFDARDKALVDAVFDQYGKFSGLYLSSLTHRAGTPWDLTWKRYGQNAVIPRALIQDHYKRVIAGGTSAVGSLGL